MVLVFKYPCADCGKMLRENKLGWCDHEDSEYYCPTCWDDDTTTLPPPPADMVAEAEKENEKYIHELFAKVMNIREAQKIIQPVLDKKFAHPIAKAMDELIADYWGNLKPTSIEDYDAVAVRRVGGIGSVQFKGHFEEKCAAFEYRGSGNPLPRSYEKQMLVDTRCWKTEILFGKPYIANYYDDFETIYTGLANYRITMPIVAHKTKVCEQATLTKKGKVMKSRAVALNRMCGFFQKRGVPFDLCLQYLKQYRYKGMVASHHLQKFLNSRKADCVFQSLGYSYCFY